MYGRSWRRLLRGAIRPAQLLGVFRALLIVERPIHFLWIYLNFSNYQLEEGDCKIHYRFSGLKSISVRTAHDYCTFFEVFCRRDYFIQRSGLLVLDVGANIGISARFFLEVYAARKIICFEPNIENLLYLVENLQHYQENVEIIPKALGIKSGSAYFDVEPTGRYGRLTSNISSESAKLVDVVEINECISSILRSENEIDYMKLDIEGHELEVFSGILSENRRKIDRIQYEWQGCVKSVER